MPKTAIRKRKTPPRRSRPTKKTKTQLTLMEIFHHDADADPNADYGPSGSLWKKLDRGLPMPEAGEVLTLDQVKSMLSYFQNFVEEVAKARQEVEPKTLEMNRRLTELEQKVERRYLRLRAKCIDKRNVSVKKEAVRQFEQSLRE